MKVIVNCFGPIAFGQDYQSPWEDVWLQWTTKPGRRKIRWAPCLVSRSYANAAQEFDPDYYSQPLQAVASGDIFIVDPKSETTEIFTPADYVDRAEAERMITTLVTAISGPQPVRFKWKRPKLFIQPV